MKEYVKLYVDVQTYYSGNTYYEEVFLPLDLWRKVENEVGMSIYIHELDGKHSEVEAEIYVDYHDEDELKSYLPKKGDGENLFYHLYEGVLHQEEFEDVNLYGIQDEVYSLCEIEEMTITYNKHNKEEILRRLNGYIL